MNFPYIIQYFITQERIINFINFQKYSLNHRLLSFHCLCRTYVICLLPLYYLNAEGGVKINKGEVAKHLKKNRKLKNER